MEGAMHQPHYAIDKRDHQWVVSVDGKELMCCTQKKKAVQMAREATHSLRHPQDEHKAANPIAEVSELKS